MGFFFFPWMSDNSNSNNSNNTTNRTTTTTTPSTRWFCCGTSIPLDEPPTIVTSSYSYSRSRSGDRHAAAADDDSNSNNDHYHYHDHYNRMLLPTVPHVVFVLNHCQNVGNKVGESFDEEVELEPDHDRLIMKTVLQNNKKKPHRAVPFVSTIWNSSSSSSSSSSNDSSSLSEDGTERIRYGCTDLHCHRPPLAPRGCGARSFW